MKTALLVIGGAAAVLAALALACCFGGLMVYWTWSTAVPAAFPGLVANGTLAADLTFGQSLALAFLFGTLVRSSNSNKSIGKDK